MPTADRPLRADARRNQELLIDAARAVFAEDGTEAKMDEIARRAGVGPGTLYRHFASRDALLAAVYRTDIEAMADRAAALAAELPWPEALRAWLLEQLDYITHKIGMGTALKSMLSNDVETLSYCRDTMRGALDQLLGPAQRAGLMRTDIDPSMLLKLVHGIGVASESNPEQAPFMLDIMLAGLRTQQAN